MCRTFSLIIRDLNADEQHNEKNLPLKDFPLRVKMSTYSESCIKQTVTKYIASKLLGWTS